MIANTEFAFYGFIIPRLSCTCYTEVKEMSRIMKKTSKLTIILVIAAACLIYGLNGGVRTNYGILLSGIQAEKGFEYSSLSFIAAVANLVFGLTQPLFGILALKKSNAFVLTVGAALSAAGMLLIPLSASIPMLMLCWGILMPAGFGALSFGVIMGAVTPVLGEKTAAFASGLISASSGLLGVILSPLMSAMLRTAGLWGCILVIAVPTAVLIPLSLWLSRTGSTLTEHAETEQVSVKAAISEAFANRSYRLLLFAFFTCGFHMAIIETHLYSNMVTSGLSDSTAAYMLSVYGAAAMLGCIITGALDSRFKNKWVGGVTFSSRLFIIVIFLILPKTVAAFAFFAFMLGLTGSATVPPVSGMTGKLFGPVKLATLFGILFVSHQIGSFISAWLGGICLTATGSYTVIWLSSAVLAILAGLACFRVEEP